MSRIRPPLRNGFASAGSAPRGARRGPVQKGWLTFLLLFGCGTLTLGGETGPLRMRGPSPPSRVSPHRSAAPGASPIVLAGALRASSETDSTKSEPSESGPGSPAEEDVPIPEYPADPVWPSWSAANDPAKQPLFPTAGYYELVRPPGGILETLEGRDYERVVAAEGDLFYEQATQPPPIDLCRPDGMAPAGVFGDHTLNTGGRILFSHRFNNTTFDGLRDGTHSVSAASVLGRFPLAPTHETAQTHYFLFEFGPTDDLTLQFILPVILRKIHYVGTGTPLVTDVTDPYDLQFNAMYVLHRWDRQQVHLNVGLRTPNGIFDRQGQFPSPASPELTYPMRTSDGTYDFLPGLTYRGQSDDWTWGAQALGTVRFGINSHGYRLGDEANLNGWISRKLTDAASASLRLNGQIWGNILGADDRLNPNLVPTNRTDLQAGQRLNLLFGLNYVATNGILQGQRLGIEAGAPVYQNLSGPQLQQRYEIWTNLTLTY